MEKNREVKFNNADKYAIKLIVDMLDLPYFDPTNMYINSQTLEKTIAVGGAEELIENSFGFYSAITNSVIINEEMLDCFTEKQLTELLLHEYIHMMSADREKGLMGFENENVPNSYNEGCTQWLTLKTMYGANISKAVENNFLYPQTVREIDNLVKEIGEENVFKGFFRANIKDNLQSLSPDHLEKVVICMQKLKDCDEEKMIRHSIDGFQEKLDKIRNQK